MIIIIMIAKLKVLIKDINLQWFDVFLVPWAAVTIFLALESNKMINNVEHYVLSIPFVFHTLFFIVSTISITLFIIFQWRKGIKGNLVFLIGLICLIIFNIIAIFTQENIIHVTVKFSETYTRTSTTTISLESKAVFIYAFISIMLFFYIGFFILPKRINKYSIIKAAIIIMYLYATFAIVYSLIVDPYASYINVVFTDFNSALQKNDYLPLSIFGNPNVFGIFLQECIFATLLHFELSKKKRVFILTGVFYFFLLITMCRTGIAIITTLLSILGIAKLLMWLIRNKKKKVFILVISSIVVLFVSSFITIFCIDKLRNGLIAYINGSSMQDRFSIWTASIAIIKERPLIFGNGYGVYNSILLDATSVGKWNSTTHNFFLSILGRAGIVGLISFFTCLSYSVVLIIKNVKDKSLMLVLFFGISMFFIHSFLDETYYPALVNCIVALVYLNVINKHGTQIIE